MKYNHTNRISLSRYEYGAFRPWPLNDLGAKCSHKHDLRHWMFQRN